MNFKKCIAATIFAFCLPTTASAQIDISKLSDSERAEVLDQLNEERIFLHQQLQNEQLKASIQKERSSYKDSSQQAMEKELEDSKQALASAEGRLNELQDRLSQLLETNRVLRKQLSDKKKPILARSAASKMYVTQIQGVKGSMNVNIYHDNNFQDYQVGDEVAQGITVDEIGTNGVYVKIVGGERIKLKEKTRKRAVMEGITVGKSRKSSDLPVMEFNPDEGFVPSGI